MDGKNRRGFKFTQRFGWRRTKQTEENVHRYGFFVCLLKMLWIRNSIVMLYTIQYTIFLFKHSILCGFITMQKEKGKSFSNYLTY